MRPPTDVSGPPVPIQEAVGEFVAALVGAGAAASKVTPTRVVPPDQLDEDDDPQGRWVVSTFADQNGRTFALSLADLAFAAATGAALGMIPAAAAADAVKANELSETLFENYEEVANIMSSILNSPSSPHLKLADTWMLDDAAVPTEVWDLLASPGKRREFAVTIDGYGGGRLGIIIR